MKKNITVTKPFLPPVEEYKKLVDKIWENCWVTNNGPFNKKFKEKLKEYLGVSNICLTVNGHMALDIAIKGLGIKGEVITTPFTFASTTHALVLNGITPVFCDIKEDDLTIDVDKIEELITPKTTAILAVHVYGHNCDYEKIDHIAKKYNLKVIYDAAHSFGVNKDGVSISSLGDVSIFSFHATKVFNSIEGGAIIFKDKKLERIFNSYINFGIEGQEQIDFVGENAKMNEFQAAMGLLNLQYIDKVIERRKKITNLYIKRISKVKGINYVFNNNKDGYTYNYSYFPIIVDSEVAGFSRDDLYDFLQVRNIHTRKYFYPLVTDYGCYNGKFSNVNIPVAKKISKKILCLPLYDSLSLDDVNDICDIIINYKGEMDNA